MLSCGIWSQTKDYAHVKTYVYMYKIGLKRVVVAVVCLLFFVVVFLLLLFEVGGGQGSRAGSFCLFFYQCLCFKGHSPLWLAAMAVMWIYHMASAVITSDTMLIWRDCENIKYYIKENCHLGI